MSPRTRAGQEQVTQTSTAAGEMNGTCETRTWKMQDEYRADLHIHTDDCVVVSYAGEKTVVHYIGLLLDEEDEDGDIEVRVLHNVDNAYVDPVVDDIRAVPVTSVNVVLSRQVDKQCPTKRTTWIKRFPVNLEHYHIKKEEM